MRAPRASILVVLAAVAGCGPASPRIVERPLPTDPLAIDWATLAREDPRLAERIGKSPFAYFRYTNRPFVDLVCARYARAIPSMPLVHAHGDAHLEQYAVAAEGRGLADFDASAVGPPIVDLARFATSLVLAFPDDGRSARAAIVALLRGYRRALEDPSSILPDPIVAARIRRRFEPTAMAWLNRVQQLIVPIPPEQTPIYEAGWSDFVSQMRARDPSIDPAFFTIKVGGRLAMGLGSARAEKFLVRIEGPTDAPEDDLVMEAKAVEPGSLGSCMHGVDLDATRVIKGQAQISNAPQRFLAAVRIDGKPFYSHTWLVHYTEISSSDVRSGHELAELAEDVGLQLGRGHAKLPDEPRLPEHRRALMRFAATFGPGLPDAATDLAAHVMRAWVHYRESSRPPPSHGRGDRPKPGASREAPSVTSGRVARERRPPGSPSDLR